VAEQNIIIKRTDQIIEESGVHEGSLDPGTTNVSVHRVATNLEYSGISLNMENSGNSQGILCNLREKF